MIPAIDPLELRRQIQALPDAAKQAAGALFTECQWPKLDSGEWTRDRLWNAAVLIHEAVEAEGYAAWTYPLDTSALVERIQALPDDLADFAADNVRDAEVPNVAYPRKWTLEHWTIADAALEHAEALAAKRLRHVHAALASAADYFDGPPTDAQRHSLIDFVTGGRTESSKKLTGPEARHIAEWAELIAAGGSGTELAIKRLEIDWKAEAKRLGTTQAALLLEAKAWARFHNVEVPAKLGDITSHRLIAALLTTADDGETIMETTADEVASLPEPDVAAEIVEAIEALTQEEITPAPVDLESAIERNAEDHAALEERLATVEATLAAILAHLRAGAEIAAPGAEAPQ